MKMARMAIIIGLLITVGVVFAGVSSLKAEAGDYYSPLYDFRLNQAVEGMGLLPQGTAMSGCNYGCIGVERLESPYNYNNAYGSVCPNLATCKSTCDCTCCGNTCYGTTCNVPTQTSTCDCTCCGNTCYGTTCNVPTQTSTCDCTCCGNTCSGYTCSQTYDNTCYGITCSLTCCDNRCDLTFSGTTCESTCVNCNYYPTCPKGKTC